MASGMMVTPQKPRRALSAQPPGAPMRVDRDLHTQEDKSDEMPATIPTPVPGLFRDQEGTTFFDNHGAETVPTEEVRAAAAAGRTG